MDPLNNGTPEQNLTSQIKEILPVLVNAKTLLGDLSEHPTIVKDLKDRLGKIEGSVLDMGKRVIDLGKAQVQVHSSGMTDEQKMDFVKFAIAIVKQRKQGFTADRQAEIRRIQDKYGIKSAMQEGVDGEGGHIVPLAFSNQIWRLASNASDALRLATKPPLTTGYKLPILRGDTNVSVTWVAEEGAVQESEPTFGKETIDAKKMMAYSKMSNELLEDEEIGLADYLIQLFSEAMGNEIDNQAWNGTGSPFTGILSHGSVNTVAMTSGDGKFSEINATYLSQLIAQIRSSNLAGSVFAFHRTVFHYIRTLKDDDKNFIWQSAQGPEPATIWGYPYLVNDQMPANSASATNTPFVWFGNLKNFQIGTKGEMTVKITDIPQILYDQTILVVRKRLAMGVALPGAFAVLKTASSDS